MDECFAGGAIDGPFALGEVFLGGGAALELGGGSFGGLSVLGRSTVGEDEEREAAADERHGGRFRVLKVVFQAAIIRYERARVQFLKEDESLVRRGEVFWRVSS